MVLNAEKHEYEIIEKIAKVLKDYSDENGGIYDFDVEYMSIEEGYPSKNGGYVYGVSTKAPGYNGKEIWVSYFVRVDDEIDGDHVVPLFESYDYIESRNMFKILMTNPYDLMPRYEDDDDEELPTITSLSRILVHGKDNPIGKATFDAYKQK